MMISKGEWLTRRTSFSTCLVPLGSLEHLGVEATVEGFNDGGDQAGPRLNSSQISWEGVTDSGDAHAR
ncbi:hypothetical protein [Bradyrhizobium genosp. P]|uniref:hypothetical protein n=1 Tax=Bradyrhizobium genosp. P TaxID=83641 RepID=UPI003CEF5140